MARTGLRVEGESMDVQTTLRTATLLKLTAISVGKGKPKYLTGTAHSNPR